MLSHFPSQTPNNNHKGGLEKPSMPLLQIDSLRCYDLVAIALLLLALDVAMYLWNTRGTQLSHEETALLRQYNEQVAIVNRLNSVETFVEQSKAIRKMNTIKKQMQELAGALASYTGCWCWIGSYLTLCVLTRVCCVVW